MIRYAKKDDLKKIVEIYNQAIQKKFQTADTTLITEADRAEWFNAHNSDRYPIFVYEEDEQVAGWISVSPYRPGRKALEGCVEISYYIASGFQGRGIGNKLVEYTLIKSRELGFHSVFAIILDRNIASINLMKKNGFVQWAHMPEIAVFDSERCGHVYYGIHI